MLFDPGMSEYTDGKEILSKGNPFPTNSVKCTVVDPMKSMAPLNKLGPLQQAG